MTALTFRDNGMLKPGDGFVYRVTPARYSGFMAEAKRADQPFEAASILYEPIHHTVWFEFGKTAEAALAKVKADVLS